MKKLPFYTYLWLVTAVNLALAAFVVRHLNSNVLLGTAVLATMNVALYLEPIMFPDKRPKGFSMTAATIFVTALTYGISGIVLVSMLTSLGLVCVQNRFWRGALLNPGLQCISAVVAVFFAHMVAGNHNITLLVIIYWIVFIPAHLVMLSMFQVFYVGGRWGQIYSDITPVHFWTLYLVDVLSGFLMLTVMKFDGLAGVAITFVILLVFTRVYSKYITVSVQSTTDDLTALFNRRYFMKNLDRYWSKSNDLSLILMDVDFFKKYNDSWGHPKGDTLLRELGSVISDCVGERGICARYGGEEFAVILPDADGYRALEFAQHIRRTVSEHKFFGMQCMPEGCVTVSIGVATKMMAAERNNLLENADIALYAVKESGKNNVQLFENQLLDVK